MKIFTLEVSLKPFYGLDHDGLRAVCDHALRQWRILIERADTLSVMFWASDGSEILEYSGNLDDEMEWARYQGNANPHLHPYIPADPEGVSLYKHPHFYRDGVEKITYRRFAEIVAVWREAVAAIGKPVRIGLTFDPSGEFAPSKFKYETHPEICLADTSGKGSFVCCYGILNADDRNYAGFPKGIPQDTSMGTFLGRQFQRLADDLDADYLWLSNGFGFGMETWMAVGPLFDGATFQPELANETRDRILAFWKDFRRECPDRRVETRGTNLGTATDLASDATPLREIYDGDFNMAPPPNSPWAAINGDFGIELAGYLSRIVELPPGEEFPFRFYTHDPWWLNSPWLDRYERQPHDIYLPLASARITAEGKTEVPQTLGLMTIDDSHGNMPDAVPDTCAPHLLRAWDERPDAAGPIVWLYPFDQLHDAMFSEPRQPERLFHVDWFMREAINNGLPVNSVISTRAFTELGEKQRAALGGRLLITPTPFDKTSEEQLLAWVESGQNILVYGPLDHSTRLRERLQLELADPLEGTMEAATTLPVSDRFEDGIEPDTFIHRTTMSGGTLRERPAEGAKTDAVARKNGEERVLASHYTSPSGGILTWVRGPLPLGLSKRNRLPAHDDTATTFPLGELIRRTIGKLGWHIGFKAETRSQCLPVLSIHRHDNGWFFSGYTPDTTVEYSLHTPFGAPLMLGLETRLRGGIAHFHQARGWRNECRVFIEQDAGVVSFREQTSVQFGVTRRVRADGLKEAKIRFFPPTDATPTLLENPKWPFVGGKTPELKTINTEHGPMLETVERVSGAVLFSW